MRVEHQTTLSESRLVLALLFAATMLAIGNAMAQECDVFDVQVATTAAPPRDRAALGSASKLIDAIPGKADIIVFGDSQAARWPIEHVYRFSAGESVWRFGVGSDRSPNTLWRLNAPQLASLKPKTVILLIGTNNLGAGQSACVIVAGVEAVSDKALSIWPEARLISYQSCHVGRNCRL